MTIFALKNINIGLTKSTNGTKTTMGGVKVQEVDAKSSLDGWQINANGTSNVAILTGSGNDTIDASKTSGMAFIDAGAGTNTVTGGCGITNFSMAESATKAWTEDFIYNFHAGDSLTFNGVTTAVEFIRGNNLVWTAFTPGVTGSAINATLVSPSTGITSITHTANSVTIHG